ncbi:DUF2703 domain-containing protein [candidate division KSB1 bacterium]|nr:DUF2703 domain-containing protein [candidate division KSB1 bacterium]
MTAKVKIQVEYFHACPHAEQALGLARQYKQTHENTVVEFIEINNDRQARETGFRGSPTILINGRDLTGAPVPAEPRLACRFYPDGLPSFLEFEKIVHKLCR